MQIREVVQETIETLGETSTQRQQLELHVDKLESTDCMLRSLLKEMTGK